VGTLANLKSEKDAALDFEESKVKVEPLQTLLIPVNYAGAKTMADRLKVFLSKRGQVDIDDRTNTVIIKDVADSVKRAKKLIAALDTQPPRVSITARIVEMANKFTRNIGFSNIKFSSNFAGLNIGEEMTFSSSAGGTSLTTIPASFTSALNTTFQLGEFESKVKILASPSVSVVANQPATIRQSVTTYIQSPVITNGQTTITLQPITAALNMKVTPIVSGEGSIFMTIDVQNEIPGATGLSVDTRSVNTQVLVDNGDTTVIGGIFNNTVSTSRGGIPFLSKLPIVGFLLNNNNLSDNRNEIFVFLTARILNADESSKRTM
jgi:type IV pilus assembly protein PilQ